MRKRYRPAIQAAEAARQANLHNRYDKLVESVTGEALNSAEGLKHLDDWRNQVVQEGGTVKDEEALDNMQEVMTGRRRAVVERQVDLSRETADARADNIRSKVFGVLESGSS